MNGLSPNGFVAAADVAAHKGNHDGVAIDSSSHPASGAWDGTLHMVHLLRADVELGRGLTDDQLAQAQQHAVLAAVTLSPGHWELDRLRDDPAVHGEVRGLFVLSGVLMTEVTIASRTCLRLLAPLELVLINGIDGSVPASWGWSVLQTAHIAVLDDRLLVIARHWPELLSALLERAGRQSQYALLQQAISQLPRVEDRLLSLLWSLADRWGVVRTDGVWLGLPLTHEKIARMIGARRPTVTLGLRALINEGLLRAEKDGWLIDRASLEVISLRTRADPLHPVETTN